MHNASEQVVVDTQYKLFLTFYSLIKCQKKIKKLSLIYVLEMKHRIYAFCTIGKNEE